MKFARLLKDDAGICALYTDNTFHIKISLFFKNEEIDISEVRATVCHELIHICKGCHNHMKPWIDYAKMADETCGYGISVHKTKYDIVNKKRKILHRMVCPECGGSWNVRERCDCERVQNGEKGI